MVCKWRLCKCAEKEKRNDRFAKVFVNVYVCIVDLCAIYVYSMFCVYVCTCMHVFVCMYLYLCVYVYLYVYLYVCICICVLCVLCVCMCVLYVCMFCICICMCICMSSPPRALLLPNLLPKYPLLLLYFLCLCGFWSGW